MSKWLLSECLQLSRVLLRILQLLAMMLCVLHRLGHQIILLLLLLLQVGLLSSHDLTAHLLHQLLHQLNLLLMVEFVLRRRLLPALLLLLLQLWGSALQRRRPLPALLSAKEQLPHSLSSSLSLQRGHVS